MIWVDYLILAVGILLILVVAVQESQDNMQDAFSGEKSDLFKQQKARGIELFFIRSTFVLAVLFVGLIFLSLALH